jgi:hypothetical protein
MLKKILGSIQVFILTIVLTSTALVGLVGSSTVAAQTNPDYDPCKVFDTCLEGTDAYKNASADNIVVSLVLGFSYFLIYVGGALAVLFIVFGGYKMISANGNDTEYKAGLSMVSNAVIGLIFIIISVTIVRLVTQVLTGLEIPGLFG